MGLLDWFKEQKCERMFKLTDATLEISGINVNVGQPQVKLDTKLLRTNRN